MDRILEILEHTHGPAFRRHRPIYRKPYPEWIDREPYPRGSRIPEFSTFSREDDKTVLEHMSRLTIQCREVSKNENCKMKLFPSFLTGQAFAWYSSLPPNSLNSWVELEGKFQTHFSRTDLGVSIVNMARLRQRPDETVQQFIMRFKRARMHYQIILPEREYVKFAVDGLDFEVRKNLKG